MLEKYIDMARQHEDFSDMTAIGMDETSRAKVHDYVILFVGLEKRRTTFVAEGKDHKTPKAFVKDSANKNKNSIILKTILLNIHFTSFNFLIMLDIKHVPIHRIFCRYA